MRNLLYDDIYICTPQTHMIKCHQQIPVHKKERGIVVCADCKLEAHYLWKEPVNELILQYTPANVCT